MKPADSPAALVEEQVANALRAMFGPDAFLDTCEGIVVALGGRPVLVKVTDAEIRPTQPTE